MMTATATKPATNGTARNGVEPEPQTKGAYARAAQELNAADGDWEIARNALDSVVPGYKTKSEVEQHLLEIGWYNAIRHMAGIKRQQALRSGPPIEVVTENGAIPNGTPKGISGETLEKGRYAIREVMMYQYPLSGGLMLGDATRKEIEDERDIYAMNEKENGIRRLWLDKVAKQMPKTNKLARNVFKDSELRELFKQAQEEYRRP